MIKKILKKVHSDHLYRNSLYLILNNVVTTGFGFFFWMICAHLYSTEQVGYATAIISAVGIVSLFSFLGLNIGLMRYLPKAKDKDKLIVSCINLCGLSSIVFSILFLILLPFLSPKLGFVLESSNYLIAFVLFTLSWVMFSIVNSIFIASRKSGIVLVKSILFSMMKLILPVLVVFLGTYGILGAYYLSALVGFVFSLYYFRYSFEIDFKLIKEMFVFSFGNYVAWTLGLLPGLVIPIMITHFIGPKETAYFYVAWMIANLLYFVPSAISQSLLTEGSHSVTGLDKKVKKAYMMTFMILIPGILLFVFFGKYLLMLFGSEYAVEGFRLLQVLSVASIFYGINQIRIMKFNVTHSLRKIIMIQFLVAFVALVGSFVFADGDLILFGIIYGIANVVGVLVR
ncbi:oligosaccharide flippase family protein [Nanoarchaeota archaeon]